LATHKLKKISASSIMPSGWAPWVLGLWAATYRTASGRPGIMSRLSAAA